MPSNADNISASVGTGGTNRATDVAWVQAYLNMVPPAQGGPATKLKQDGLVGPKTTQAIVDFQRRHFGAADGRVDPGRRAENKFVELEPSPEVRGQIHIEAARRQAQIWMDAGRNAVRRLVGPEGNVTFNPADQTAAELFELAFRLKLRGPGPAGPAQQLRFVRDKFDRAATSLRQPIRPLLIKFMAAQDELRTPRLEHRAPLAVGGTIILSTYKFTDFDPACGFGLGPFTRAAVLLQASFVAADFSNDSLTTDELFILSGFSPTDLAIRSSGHYSFFCQGVDAGGLPQPFRHNPTSPGGWTDRPGLG